MCLLSDYEHRTAWKYEPIHGSFQTADGLKNKVSASGNFLPFYGNTVVFRLDAMGVKIIQMMQKVLQYWLQNTGMLASPLPSDTIHMTLHDLISPENCSSDNAENYKKELEKSQLRAVEITEKIRRNFAGRKINMVADRIVNMVSKSIVLLLKPQTEQDYELLLELYGYYDEITSFPYPYTPHITLAYYKPGMLDGEILWNAIEHAQIRSENAPLFEFCPEGITVQTFRDMEHYNDIPKRICFCCDGGMNRSVLSANILNSIAAKREIPIVCEARSAFSNTQGIAIPQQVWDTLQENGIDPDRSCVTARYLERHELSHFSDFAGITGGAMTHFLLLGIPEERFYGISEYFMGVEDPQYGAISYQEAFQKIYSRAEQYLNSMKDRDGR